MNQTTNPGEVIITVDHLVSVDEGGAPVSRCASTPLGHLYRAEVAAAHGDSEAALAEIDAAGPLEPAETRRAELIRAELAIQAGDCATAEAIAYETLGAAGAAGDRSAETRARIVAVRAKVRDGRFRSALADLPMLRRECNEFRTAICDHLAAVSHLKLGDREQALDLALAAIHTFRACGAVRWEGWARNVIGLVLTDRGELDAAIREFEHAEKLAAECGVVDHMLVARNNTAFTLLAGDRIADAVATLRDGLTWETGPTIGGAQARVLLALGLGIVGRRDEALPIAREAVEMADAVTNEEFAFHGHQLVAWLEGDRKRLDVLNRRAIERQEPNHSYIGLVYAADVVPADRPDEAFELLTEAQRYVRRVGVCAATTLERRVRARLDVAPIRVEDDVVTVDTSRGLPKLDDAVNAVKRHLMARALDAAEGNQSRAADLIGMDRSRYHYQWRVLRGLDPRPVKRGETTE